MSVYAWPDYWTAARFELRVLPNTRTHVGPYTPTVQVLDLLGERWILRLDLTPTEDDDEGGAREAFFDRLKGPSHQFSIFNLKRPVPRGTLRDGLVGNVVNGAAAAVAVVNGSGAPVTVVYGTPMLLSEVPQLANTATMRMVPGYTLKAGDMLGLYGQLVRIMADTVADGAGNMPIEFQPRARRVWPAFTPAVWARPTANFMLRSDGVPTPWLPGFADAASVDAIEVI